MIEMMETSPEIARALFKGDQSAFWRELAENLNSVGPPIKAAGTWKRIWFDYKCAVKKKLRDNRTSLNATGGGPCRTKPLNELEERVANLTNLKATVAGNSAARFGISRPNNNSNNNNSSNSNTIEYQNQSESNQQQEEQPEQQEQHEQQEQFEQRNRRIAGQSTSSNRGNRKRRNTEAVMEQNKAMLDMMAKYVEVQEKSLKLQEETNNALKECTQQLKVFNDLLTQHNKNN
ncbi:protein kinase 4-like [Anopheles moucheti]|uniref:protein kinase 4-like n=1 Tax=Anopheles moucheti TaxID=186751 RepID=UPI0022EFEEDB|nr:protein kinase 4-like [Anopheles moucheti]